MAKKEKILRNIKELSTGVRRDDIWVSIETPKLNNMIKLVVFDWNGTLFADTLKR